MSSSMDYSTTTTAAVSEAVSRVLQQNFDVTSERCLKTCLQLIDGILKHPYDRKYRQIKLDNPVIAKKVVACQGGVPLLQAIGFIRTTATTTLQQNQNVLQFIFPEDTTTWTVTLEILVQSRQVVAKTLQKELNATKIPPMPTVVAMQAQAQATTTFNPYQAQRVDQLAASTGQASSIPPSSSTYISPTEQQLAVLQQTQKLVEAKLFQQQATQTPNDDPAVQHQWKAWRDTPMNSTSTATDTDTDTATKSDAQLLAAHAKKQFEAAQAAQNQGFTTKAMRDLKRLQSQKVYGSTILRIHFSDGSGVMGHFLPSTTIQQVMQALMKQVLIQDLEDCKFKLFTTPPRTLLDPTKTLLELQLVPAAKLHVQWIQPPVVKNTSTTTTTSGKGWFLRDEWIMDKGTSSSSLSQVTLPQGVSLVNNNTSNDNNTNNEGNNATVPKKKKTKADKEKLLLQRMMGK